MFLKSGYAPPEQYLKNGKQGPWVDVYGLCATIYMALTRIQPPDSLNRLQAEKLPPLTANSDIPRSLANIIEKGMSLKIADRYPSMTVLYKAITEHTPIHKTKKYFYLFALLIFSIGLLILYFISQPLQSNLTASSNDIPVSSEESGATSKLSGEATDAPHSTSEETTTSAATTTESQPVNTTTKQAKKEKNTGFSYNVLPIEEDEYQVLPIEED
ncbi:MAG: hypothetical protein PUC12_08210 [Clostridiales bacterium]|nr:hypothetical protein [Clostridiales bacterium]